MLKVSYKGKELLCEACTPLLPLSTGYTMSHKGVSPDLAADAVEQFRAVHGQIQTNTPYLVEPPPGTSCEPHDINSIPAGVVSEPEPEPDPVKEPVHERRSACAPKRKPEAFVRHDGSVDTLKLPKGTQRRLLEAGFETIQKVRMHPDLLIDIPGITGKDAMRILSALR